MFRRQCFGTGRTGARGRRKPESVSASHGAQQSVRKARRQPRGSLPGTKIRRPKRLASPVLRNQLRRQATGKSTGRLPASPPFVSAIVRCSSLCLGGGYPLPDYADTFSHR